MSESSMQHASFTIVRDYGATAEQLYAAWTDPAAKTEWFGPSEKPAGSYSLDFRVGGREHLTIVMPDGPAYSFDALYQDIVAGERFIYSYDMHHGEQRISVSLAAVEIAATPAGARLTLVEHGVFLDGLDTPGEREHGTNALMDALGSHLAAVGAPS